MLHDAKISVPGDFSIIGFGDLDWFHLWGPGLTTMDVPLDDLAEAVSLQFFEQLPRGGKFQAPQPFLMRLPGKLLVRNSTAPPKAGRES